MDACRQPHLPEAEICTAEKWRAFSVSDLDKLTQQRSGVKAQRATNQVMRVRS